MPDIQRVTTNFPLLRNQAEMAHTCRGTISLHGALIHTENPASFNFVVSNGGGTQTFHLRASNEVERQKWVTALETAKVKAIQVSQCRTGLFGQSDRARNNMNNLIF